jgi:hypothetical protein
MNNKRIIIGILFILFIRFSEAQDSKFVPEWAFGVNGGMTYSKISFNSMIYVPQVLLPQYTSGLTVRYISENNFGLVGELNYSLQGWKEKTDTAYLNKYTRSLAYIEMPLMTQLHFNLEKRVRLIFNVGPQIGYNVGDTWKMEINSEEKPEYYEMAIQRKFNYGLRGGMGVEIRTGVGSFILGGNYFFGLSDIFNNKRSDIFQSSANHVIGVKLTYLIRRSQN